MIVRKTFAGRRRFHNLVLQLLATFAFLSTTAEAAPHLTVSSDSITIDSLAPGSSVVVVFAMHQPVYYMSRIASGQVLLTDDDGDGTIKYEVKGGVPLRSIWIAVDAATGEATIASPQRFTPYPMSANPFDREAPVALAETSLEINREHTTVLVLRPHSGAWGSDVRADVALQRANATRSRGHVDFSQLHGLRKDVVDKAPDAIIPGDVIVVVDPVRLDYWFTTVQRGAGR